MSEADQNLEETVKIIKNLQKTLFTWRVFVCYTTEVASHASGWSSEIQLTIKEGKFHQVKRMTEAVGKKVVYLKRISMGVLTLPDDLKKGECRQLTAEEEKKLKDSIGRS